MNKNIFIVFFSLFLSLGVVKAQHGVGINTQSPKATLDIEGDLIVRHPDEGTGNLYVFQDATTKELCKKEISKSPIYTFEYDLTLDRAGSDWIDSYNTKIKTDEYYIYPVGAVLYDKETGDPALIGHDIRGYDWNSIFQVKFKETGKEWELKADFNGADPSGTNKKYYWKINVIAISKAYLGVIDMPEVLLPANGIGALSEDPMANDNFQIGEYTGGNTYDNYEKKAGVLIREATGTLNTPESELDVDGKVRLTNVSSSTAGEKLPLVYNDRTKYLEVRKRTPITFLTGKITTRPGLGYGDWVENFNTKIPADKYDLVITNAYLDNESYEKFKDTPGWVEGMAHVLGPVYKGNTDNRSYNPQENIKLDKSSGTWKISADYKVANPVCGKVRNREIGGLSLKNNPDASDKEEPNCDKTFSWNFGIMLIDKGFGKNLGVFEGNIGSNNQGSAEEEVRNYGDNFITYMINRPQQ